MKKYKIEDYKIEMNELNILLISIQLVLSIVFLILLTLSIFNNKLFSYSFFSLGLTLISMGINNKYVFLKKNKVIVDIIIGILIVIFSFFKINGVI